MNIVSKMKNDELSASEFNQIPDECENLITSAGFIPSETNLSQMADAVAQIVADGNMYIATGDADAIILSQQDGRKAIKNLTNGVKGTFRAIGTNTSIVTINLCNLGNKAVVKDGVELETGDIKEGVLYNFIYDELNNRFEISNFLFQTDETMAQITNRLYDGIDLTQKFADEIANFSDEWQWIKSRIDSGNFEGILVGDYIPVTINAGTAGGKAVAQQTLQCQVAGINTYKNCCDTEVGNHIDFISREVIDTEFTWNPKDNNNGTSANNAPWLASQIYATLNGINNYSTSAQGNVAHGGNYLNAGILQLLPTKLRNLIVQKRIYLEKRYNASTLQTQSMGASWDDIGLLWLPYESEVYGTQYISNTGTSQGYWNASRGLGVAYPIYLGQGRNRVKRTSAGVCSNWWLLSVTSYNSTNACDVSSDGSAGSHACAHSGIRVPLCFRIG